ALSWVASADASSTNPVTYQVERAPGNCGTAGQVFAAVGSPQAGTTYTDSTVAGGQDYCYRVRSIGQNGAESGPSNLAAGAVPPFPPNGLTVNVLVAETRGVFGVVFRVALAPPVRRPQPAAFPQRRQRGRN
ncbi:MAG: hypothetical protein ACRD2F_15920, partial [Terriglobales bacterium]